MPYQNDKAFFYDRDTELSSAQVKRKSSGLSLLCEAESSSA